MDGAGKKKTSRELKAELMDLSAGTRRKDVEKLWKCPCKDATTYRALLSAAREIFAREGYSGTSVREIVAAADVTKPRSAKPTGEERG
jgi:AcrR family transcriptional regulator